MRVEVINTGTELLLGQVVNTHLAYLGERLFELELRVTRQDCVPDGDAIAAVLEEAFTRSEVVLVTGGLGPTSDDITREIVAGMLGMPLELDEKVEAYIEKRFQRRGRTMSPENLRQAMVPTGAEVIWNPHGTAPGLYFEASEGRPHLFLLPGPPRELRPMFERSVVPKLHEITGSSAERGCRTFRVVGVGESDIAARLESGLREIDRMEIGYCTRYGEVDVRCIGTETMLSRAEELVRAAYPENLFSATGESMGSVIVNGLLERGETLATAESCTGGRVGDLITNVPGASAVFYGGFLTYANEAKEKFLGVDPAVLARVGAVSREVAAAMAEGCQARSGATHALAVTGIAGPGGGSKEKPVGTVYVALKSEGQETVVAKLFYPTDRETFKEAVARAVLDLLRRRLAGLPMPVGEE